MYRLLTENNNAVPLVSGNGHGVVNFSMLRSLDAPVSFEGISIKYVYAGAEDYIVNGRKFKVSKGEYLLGNSFSEGTAKIESRELVKGTCINLKPGILSEVLAAYKYPDGEQPDPELNNYFTSAAFFENKYEAEQTRLGRFLLSVAKNLDEDPTFQHQFMDSFFYQLAENIILDSRVVAGQLKSIHAIRAVTRKELYRKTLRGKAFIDHHFCAALDIKLIAREANLSEYHFFRLFKSVFKVTPYQYIISRRLELARQLIEKKEHRLTEIAEITGFSDIQNFSKAYKNKFGFAPSRLVSE